MGDLSKMKFINGYNPKKGGTYRKERVCERVLSSELCNAMNRPGVEINENLIDEALIASYDICKVKEIFERKYGTCGIAFSIASQESGGHELYSACISVTEKVLNAVLKDDIVEFMKFCGYIIQPMTRHENNTVKMFFKPKFQSEDCSELLRSSCRYIYHMTEAENKEHILKNGLVPSSKNKLFNYNDRVYFVKGNNLNEKVLGLLKAVWASKGKKPSVVFMLDLQKIPDGVKFYTDFDAEESIFTYDNISPSAIIGCLPFEEIIN